MTSHIASSAGPECVVNPGGGFLSWCGEFCCGWGGGESILCFCSGVWEDLVAGKANGADPTVYVPYLVRIELVRAVSDPAQLGRTLTSLERPANYVTLTPDFVFVCDPRGGSLNIPVGDVDSVRVVVTDQPPDYVRLRERYPNAYDAWDNWVLWRLHSPGPSTTTLGQLADRTGRPPHHLVLKAREIGWDVPPDSGEDSGDESSTRHADDSAAGTADPFLTDHYLVHVAAHGKTPSTVVDVLARHDVPIYDVYRISSWGFAAHLRPDKAERIAADPGVIEVEPDTGERLAPHFRMPVDIRIPGSYNITVRRTSRPRTVAARAGVVPEHVFDLFNWFAADLTDAQLHALRRDPEVDHIEDDAVVTLDD